MSEWRPSILVGAAAVVWTAAAHADEPQRGVFKLVLNSVDQPEITVVLRGRDVLVRRADLEKTGMHDFRAVEEKLGDETLIALSSVRPEVKWVIDDNDVSLRLEAPASILPSQVIDARSTPAGIEYQRDASAFLNYAPRLTNFRVLTGVVELGGSDQGRLYTTSAFFSTDIGVSRGLTSVVIDDRPTKRRLIIGDALISGGALGASFVGAGLTLSRVFAIDPYYVRTPSLSHTGTVLAPATMDVFVNGIRVRREQLDPGTFQLSNLQPTAGSGVATYVIRDAFGREQRITTPYYVSLGVLAPGVSEFTYSMAFRRDRIATESFDYGAPGILLRHRAGIFPTVTLGARLETKWGLISGGPSVTKVTPIGQFDLEIAASLANGEDGGAALFASYAYLARGFAAGVTARAASEQYSNMSLSIVQDRPLIDGSGYVSVPVTARAAVSTTYTLSHYRDRGMSGRIAANGVFQIARDASLVISGARSHYSARENPFEIFASLNIVLGGNHNASVASVVQDGRPQTILDANKPLPVSEGYGYRASATIGELSRTNLTGQYQTRSVRVTGQFDHSQASENLTLEAAGSIVLIRKAGMFTSLPVGDGYGVIRVPGVKGVRGYVNNHEIGRTDKNGNLFVPNLLPYYGNRLGIADQDVPFDHAVEANEKTIAPPYRGAALAAFPVSKKHYYRGKVVVVKDGQQVIPEYGEVTVHMPFGDVASPASKEGEFELEGITAGRHPLKVQFGDDVCSSTIDVPDGEGAIIDMGLIRCVMREQRDAQDPRDPP